MSWMICLLKSRRGREARSGGPRDGPAQADAAGE
ncbi:hypothetical protein BDSB_08545 [Burkholderia dolosa PC543]|nr:hypothetical protein BDSB_08545 [Burkholderia dolosa PC543]